MTLREKILAAQDIVSKSVDVPEWGVTVLVRSMDGLEREAYEEVLNKAKTAGTKVNVRSLLISRSAVDETGALVFTPDDLQPLAKKSSAALDRVFTAALKLNGFGPDEVAEAEKNS